MRPRANTISHVDNATLGMIAAANSSASRNEGSGYPIGHTAGFNSMHGLPGVGGYSFRGMSTATGHHGNPHVLPKIETNGLNNNVGNSLRTAPAFGGMGSDIDTDSLYYEATINPAQLHFSDSPSSMAFDNPDSPYPQGFSGMIGTQPGMADEGSFPWMNGFDQQLSFQNANEQAIDGSSPSAMSNGSPGAMSEVMLDGSNNAVHTSAMWQTPMVSQVPIVPGYPYDLSAQNYAELLPNGQLSPKSLQAQAANNDQFFATPPSFASQAPLSSMHILEGQTFHAPKIVDSDTSTASDNSSNRQSSVTSVSTDSINESTRQALLVSLSQPTYGHPYLRNTQLPVSSPLTSDFSSRTRSISGVSLPSTFDLQRYVSAYIQCFHPHLPFLHVPTLSFDSTPLANSHRTPNAHLALMLSMAAIGALYESDRSASKELFEHAKQMIQLYLEEQRQCDISNGNESVTQDVPLWLVQSMLLNVIYGHNSGEKLSADIASRQMASLISLAKSAELTRPLEIAIVPISEPAHLPGFLAENPSAHINGGDTTMGNWNTTDHYQGSFDQSGWLEWKLTEERKRTLFTVFILSSLLVSAYNHAPALMNSEVLHDLPCDEGLWSAESAETWRTLGGRPAAEQDSCSFASALGSLLTASQRQQQRHMPVPSDNTIGVTNKVEGLPEIDFKSSTFGCLVLINALHNYMWETRQRHMGRPWTALETETMRAHLEPALRAWQAAWMSCPGHSLERPNPFGCSSLSADCIPLLDLAYLRLFVNLGRSKEAFWQRDFTAMAEELARGTELIQHGEPTSYESGLPFLSPSSTLRSESPTSDGSTVVDQLPDVSHAQPAFETQDSTDDVASSKRERHLRHAAWYAANSLSMSVQLNVTFADFSSRELPIQSALCAFDCTQVLAEWAATMQQRVGRYLGILGRDEIDFEAVPACMLLEEFDRKLLEKIEGLIASFEAKMSDAADPPLFGAPSVAEPVVDGMVDGKVDCDYGSKLLHTMARMLERAAVWPVTGEMVQALQIQAAHMRQRAEGSLNQR